MIANLFYALSTHSKVRDKLEAEVDQLYQKHQNIPLQLEDYEALPYLDLVIKETMRLYPSVAMQTTRIATKPDKLGPHHIEIGVKY